MIHVDKGTTRTGRPRLSLSTRTLIGWGAGIACGLFFGEYTAVLSFLGDAFIGLLQMTVLPYIVVSLIANIGRRSAQESRQLLRLGGTLLAFFLGYRMGGPMRDPAVISTAPIGLFFQQEHQ
jgi:Na+/H+-dicarboxylate symporter